MKFSIYFLIGITFFTIKEIKAQDCSQNIGGNLSSTLLFSNIIDCDNGDVTLTNAGSHPSGSGNIYFDSDVTLNSLSISFVNGTKPVELIIPAGVTVTILSNLTFVGQANKDKYLTVNGTLIIGGTLDFGDVQFEIDGSGSIDAGEITGAGDVTCSGSQSQGTCPDITADECDDDGGDFCTTDVSPPPVLPIDLLYFNFVLNNYQVELEWSTASEENFDYFTIERSTDAKNYEVIGTLPGNGWSDRIINYTFTDHNPLLGRAYYRLKSTDFDGYFEYFTPVMVHNASLNRALSLSANPIGEKPLKFRLNFMPEQEISVSIVNISGKEVFAQVFDPGFSTYEVPERFERGVYLLRVFSGEDVYTVRFLKE